MGFRKDYLVYEGKSSKVYINQCHNKGHKTYSFAVRKDDDTGYGELLGLIRFSGAWRQYIFEPTEGTVWSTGCLNHIVNFISNLNMEWRRKHGKKTVCSEEGRVQ